jgi:hypothetical protein
MIVYVMLKIIFNQFASIHLTYDMWSQVDFMCAGINLCSMLTFTKMTVHDILDPNVKKIFNYLMLLVVFATWARLIFFVLVISSFSNILMTIK